jgi:serine/threonine protein kinase
MKGGDQISKEAKNLVFSLLNVQPELRPTINEILASAWLTKGQRAS